MISGTLAACVVTYEIVRRVAVLRPLFGLRVSAFEPTAPVPPPPSRRSDLSFNEKC